MFCYCFVFILFKFNYSVIPINLNIYLTDPHQVCRISRTVVVHDLKLAFRSFKVRCCGNQFCGWNPSPIHRNGFACDLQDGDVREKVHVLRWTQANQLTDQLTIINRRLGG